MLCASTTWQERRDGLLSLQSYLAQEVKLTDGELKHLTEIFAKMFTDAHTKGMALFLDTLQEVCSIQVSILWEFHDQQNLPGDQDA